MNRARILKARIRPLTERQRQALALYVAGCGRGEIARRMGVSKAVAYQHLLYALKKSEEWRRKTQALPPMPREEEESRERPTARATPQGGEA